jgi:predicted membrane chloride channel (bestrophin family)
VYTTLLFLLLCYLSINMKFMCYVRLNCKFYLYAKYEKHYQILFYNFDKNVTKKSDVSYSSKRQVSESVVLNYVMCFTTRLYLFNDYKCRLKYFLLPFSVIGMNIHYITPVICIICIFYTMLVCRIFILM